MLEPKQIIVDSVKFNKDTETGYYLSSKFIGDKRIRLHRYIWSKHNGDIPEGYEIHHIDHDKGNNNIDNLECVKESEHSRHHANEYIKNNYDEVIKNLNENARPKASDWHGTEEGIEWHKKQYQRSLGQLEEESFICKCCGKEFKSKPNGKNHFCSNKCKSKHRRDSGVDDVKRICVICSKEFITNKYSKAKTCSRRCVGALKSKN